MKFTPLHLILAGSLCLTACGEEPDEEAVVDVTDDRPEQVQATDDTVEPDRGPVEIDEPTEPTEPVTPVDEPCLLDDGCIDTFPARILDSTVGGTRAFDSYSCQPDTDESGPERVYRVELREPGFLAVKVAVEAAGVDVDAHVLLENDADSCVDRGNRAAGSYFEAGTYWVVADTWVDADGVEYAGDFELVINLTRAEDLRDHGMNSEMASDALTAFSTAWEQDDSERFEYAITDFSLHSRLERQWIVDLATGELLYRLHVAHGATSAPGADTGVSSVFSNTPQSHQSSLGMLRTAETYVGDYGYSLRLDGLEPVFNDNVRDRFIVVHPQDGSSQDYVDMLGEVLPTRGCPAIAPNVSAEVIDTISGGALMFFWYPDPTYRSASTYLN